MDKNLPDLLIKVEGKVLSSNLDDFYSRATRFISNIKTQLVTDDDFNEAEMVVKSCGTAENTIDLAKKYALQQTVSIDNLFRTLDKVREEIRSKRLSLEKTIKARKEAIRSAVLTNAIKAFDDHTLNLRKRVGINYVVTTKMDLHEATKGVKTIASLEAKANEALKNAMLEASKVADIADANIKSLVQWRHLFPDLSSVCTKSEDDFAALLKIRIAEYREAEEKREKWAAENLKALAELHKTNNPICPDKPAETEPMQDTRRDKPIDLVSRFMKTTALSGVEAQTVEGWIRAYLKWVSPEF